MAKSAPGVEPAGGTGGSVRIGPVRVPTAPSAKERIAETVRNATPEEIKNLKAHAEFIKNNPDRFQKDPDPVRHVMRMKNDSDYRSDLSRANYIKQTMKEISAQEKQGTQAGHAVTQVDRKTGTAK